MKAIKTDNLDSIKEKIKGYQVVAIDEGQFFNDIVDFC